MEIESLKTTNLRNEAHIKFHLDVETLIIEASPARLGVAMLFPVYQAANVREDNAFKKIVKSELTEKIKDADKTRDTTYKSLTGVVKSLQKHYNPEIKSAAVGLMIVFNTFGKNLTSKSYDEQTAAIINILQELRGNYATHVEIVKMVEMVDELERTNNVFDALMKQRLDESSQKNSDKMIDARAETDSAYSEIRKRINAAVIMEGPENYAEFINKLNLLIDRYKLLISKSHGKKKVEPKAEPAAAAKPEELPEEIIVEPIED